MERGPGGRKRRKKGAGRGDGRAGQGRRTPPPPATGLELRYLQERQQAGIELVIVMTDGRTVRGPIDAFDRDLITIAGDDGPVVIRKTEIRYLHEA